MLYKRLTNICINTLCPFLLVACGVHVGNPHDDGDSDATGTQTSRLTVEIGDAPVDELSSVYLNIKSILIGDPSDNWYKLQLTEGVQEPVDVLALQDGLTSILVKEQVIPMGTYSSFIIGLDEKKPGWTVHKTRGEEPLSFPSGENFIRLDQYFSVEGDQETALVLHLDLRQSLQYNEVDKEKIDFNPVVSTVNKSLSSVITGSVEAQSGEALVCAYRPQSDSQEKIHENTKEISEAIHSMDEKDKYRYLIKELDASKKEGDAERQKAIEDLLANMKKGNGNAAPKQNANKSDTEEVKEVPKQNPNKPDSKEKKEKGRSVSFTMASKNPNSRGNNPARIEKVEKPSESAGIVAKKPPQRGRLAAEERPSQPCEGAFGVASVRSDSTFSLHHLEPGQYELQLHVVTSEEEIKTMDIGERFLLKAGESKNLGELSVQLLK